MSKRSAPPPASNNLSSHISFTDSEVIDLESGFGRIQREGITPFISFIQNNEREFFKAKEFVTLYDLIFKMCIQRDPYNWSDALYQRYTQSIREYLNHHTKPALQTAVKAGFDLSLMQEWSKRWANHKLIVTGLSKLFMYLDRFYTPNTDGVLPLKEQGFKLYKDLIFDPYHPKTRECILNAIQKERAGETFDRHLLKETIDVFIEIGNNLVTVPASALQHPSTNTPAASTLNKKLDIYQRTLEESIIDHAVTTYKRKSITWLEEYSAPAYLAQCESVLEEEKQRVDAYLHRTTNEPLQRACYKELLKLHQKSLLEKPTGLNQMLSEKSTVDLSRMYRLYKLDPTDLEPISQMFTEYVKGRGIDVVEKAKAAQISIAAAAKAQKPAAGEQKTDDSEATAEKPTTPTNAAAASKAAAPAAAQSISDIHHKLVSDLIQLHSDFNNIVSSCFEKSQLMQKALKRAFEDFINQDNKVSKLLAKYANDVLRKGSKVEHRESVSATLENIVFLYGYIQEKDIFERDYQNYLSHRLLNGLCESEHSEKEMIAKLKTECGYQWTNKLEGMFKDVQLSKDLMTEYRNLNRYDQTAMNDDDVNSAANVSLDVNVCTTGYWPVNKQLPTTKHPQELLPACDKFKRFYLHKHSGHKLEWRFDQGQAEITVDFNEANPVQSRKALVCTTYQMMILLQFNQMKRVTYKQLLDMTGIPHAEISSHLLSLCHPKVNILMKKPNTKTLEDDHLMQLNPNYKNPLKKVTVPHFQNLSVAVEKDEEEDKVIEIQRKHQMDAAIVRIMKTRKTLKHNVLVTEVAAQLQARFKPKSNDIKKRIEAMIEQEYMERDMEDRGVYRYLA